MPLGEARRMGSHAAAPPLAVPQPGLTAARSPPRTVHVPDPAVPRGALPVVPTGPEPVVPGGGPPPTRGMQGAAPMGRPTAGEQAGDAAQEAAVAGPRDISELLAQTLEAYRRTAAGSDGAAPEGADAGELIAQALAAVHRGRRGPRRSRRRRLLRGDRKQGGVCRRRRHRRRAAGLWSPVGGVPRGKEWRTGCGSGGSGARWHPVSRV